MAANLTPLVDAAAAAFGTALEGATERALSTWLSLVETWNARIDLTAARTPQTLVDLLMADALALAPHLPAGARCVDVGSGAGAPGLALAILRPDLAMTLVEPLGKRASFLRTVLGHIDRADVRIERARAESLPSHGWDVAVSRATLAPAEWLRVGATLVVPGGAVWALLASGEPPTCTGTTLDGDWSYVWPLTSAPRRAVLYRVDGVPAGAPGT